MGTDVVLVRINRRSRNREGFEMPICKKHNTEMYPVTVERLDHEGESLGYELDNYVCPDCEYEAHEAERRAFEHGMNGE